MKRNLGMIAGALVVSAVSAQAQGAAGSPQCASTFTAQTNACNTAIDLFNYMAPQLGASIVGGNTTLGQGGSLGGFPHVAVTVRGNALKGSLPQVDKYDPSSSSRTLDTKDQPLGLPAVDAAVGVFGGLPLGVTKVGGLDLLLSGAYIPAYSGSGVSVKVPNGSLKVGYGARIGLLQEGLLTPGIGFSYMKRDLPTVDLSAKTGTLGGQFDVNGLSVKTTSWRATASKSLLTLGLALGVGQDSYDSKAQIRVSTTVVPVASSATVSQSITRTNYFADLSLNMMVAKFVAEVGMVQGGKIPTYNTFKGTAADASRLFASAGLRIGI
ncbi:MAG: hypothetical protein ACJ79K_13850 [Gemmatimonadaceae bacterium]